jgi:glycosyltransferase involved in cell wall biosynthesis
VTRVRILQVITDTDRRGAQVFALDLGEEPGRLGHVVTTVALTPGSRRDRVDVRVLGDRARAPRTLLALHHAIGGADVTIAHGSSTLLACGLARLGTRRPFVYRQISDSRFWAPSLLRRGRVRQYLRTPRLIVALSQGAADTLVDYLKVPPERIVVMPNGVPQSRFRPPTAYERRSARRRFGLPDEGFVVLFIGALVPEKGADVAIRSMQGVDGRLLIVGDGPERERLRQLAARLVPEQVRFVPGLDDVLPAYHSADVLVLPSLGGDSMPAVIIEAAYCGVASIATDVGGGVLAFL